MRMIRTGDGSLVATRILVVDDDPFVRELVKETLSFEADFAVEQAADGAAALSVAETQRPHVVLLDVRLGGAPDGLEVCRLLQANQAPPAVIFLTGMADNGDVQAGLEAGAKAYLTKPFSPLELIETVRGALGESE